MQPEIVQHSQEQSIRVRILAPLTQLYDLEKALVFRLNTGREAFVLWRRNQKDLLCGI